MDAAVRDRMGRAVRVGLNRLDGGGDERPFQGRIVHRDRRPRPLAWADRTTPMGSKSVVQHRRSARGFRPEGPILRVQANGLGIQRPTPTATLKGSFPLAYAVVQGDVHSAPPPPTPKPKRATGRNKKGGGE